jgi:hypothetical protein
MTILAPLPVIDDFNVVSISHFYMPALSALFWGATAGAKKQQ